MGWHVFPSRQLDRHVLLDAPGTSYVSHFRLQLTIDCRPRRLIAVFDALAVANQDLVALVPSLFEHIHPALVINEPPVTPHAPAEKACREIYHIHRDKNFSLHAMMSPRTARQARRILSSVLPLIKKGWGERHPLSISCPRSRALCTTRRRTCNGSTMHVSCN